MAEQSPRRRAQAESRAGDMAKAVAIILVPIVVIIVLFSRNLPDAPVQPVDYQPQLALARAEAPYEVLAPQGLPTTGDDGWVPTVARWTKRGAPGVDGQPSPRNQWQLGLLRPGGPRIYFALNQGDASADRMVTDVSRDGIDDGTSRVAGVDWRRLVSQDGRTRSLVHAQNKVTTMVTADADYPALEAFAATLSDR